MTAVVEIEEPNAQAGAGTHRPPRRSLLAGVVAVSVAATVAAVLVVEDGSGSRPSKPAAPATVVGVAGWFAAASGPSCKSEAEPGGLPLLAGAISCQLRSGVNADFGRAGSSSAADQYINSQARARPGSSLTSWVGSGSTDRGTVLFFRSNGTATVIWTYDGQPYVGAASSSGSLATLESWWTDSGRRSVDGG